MKKHYLTIGIAIICAVVFFFIGRATVSSSPSGAGTFSSSTRGAFAGRGGAGGAGGAALGLVAGQIVSVSNGVITVSLANGNSENVYFSSSTPIIEPQPAPASALKPGTTVMIGGTTNSDGSVTAQTIQLRVGSSTGAFGRGG